MNPIPLIVLLALVLPAIGIIGFMAHDEIKNKERVTAGDGVIVLIAFSIVLVLLPVIAFVVKL